MQIASIVYQVAKKGPRSPGQDQTSLQEQVLDCLSICCFGTFDQVVRDLQVAEARIGRLSSSQREFITLQSEKNSLVEMGRKRKRSNEEDALLRRVQTKLKNRRRDMSDYDDR